MRIVMLLLILVTIPAAVAGQTRQAAAARAALVVTVTDPQGALLPGVHVEVLGASDRMGDTDEKGTVRFANMRAGSHRLRFTGDGVTAFEREVAIRAGQAANIEVMLHPAADAASPEGERAPPTAAAAPAGPPGQPTTLSILTLLDRELIRREPRKETVLGCSGNARTTLLQLNEPMPERLYDTAESMYYVVGGEGTIRIDGEESVLAAGSYALVPRGTSHAITRRGRNPIVLLAILSGEPCPTNP